MAALVAVFPADEASEFAATLFNRRGHIKKRVAPDGKGVWGRELNEDALVAYLQEFRLNKDVRNQGIGGWVLGEILKHSDVYLDVSYCQLARPTPWQ